MNTLNNAFRSLNSFLWLRTIAISIIALAMLLGGLRLTRTWAAGTISLTTLGGAYTQDFNTLANSGTSSAVPTGWDFSESGTNANTTYTAGTGSSNTGDTYSFGASSNTERAFGGLQSGSLNPTIGASFTNNTGSTVTSLLISYTGEQWRIGNSSTARDDRLDFQYSLDATSLASGTWTDVNSLDFTNPIKTAASAGALDGNAAANRTAISFTITGLSIANGSVFWIRWLDFNASGSDDGLAVDNFSITPMAGAAPLLSINDVSMNEGDSGATTFTFTVSLSSVAGAGGVTFDIATQDNSATVADNDYAAKTLTSQTIPQGQQTYTFNVTVNGDTTIESNETFFVSVTNVTGATVGDGQGVGTIVNDDAPLRLIHDIQGTAETPNFNGMLTKIQGIVVGDFQGSSNLSGFFVQEEDVDADADPASSEGIFIFDPSTLVNVNVGDKVTVTGTVTNFGGPPGLTELASLISVVVNSSGNPLPAAATVSLPVTTSPAADLERFEGMRATFSQTLFVTANEDLGGFGELTLSANSPLYIPTNSIDPNDNPASGNSTSGASNVAAVTAQQTTNNNNRITLNDGKTGSNPNPIPFIGAGANATIRRGDSIANLSGILSFGFGVYRIEPTTLPLSFTAANPRTASPDAVGGSLRVASFNVENYFLTTSPSSGYRGPNNATEQTRKRDKVVAALAGLNADVIGLIELEKATTNGSAAADLAAGLTAAMGGGANTYAAISDPATLIGTDLDIKNGIIYRTSAVTPVGGVMTDTAAVAGTYSRDPISQTFQKNSTSDKFTITVNHFRSKGCGGSGADADQGDGQACFNARRRSQAQALLVFITNTLIPIDPDVLVVGDLNSYSQEDPIDVFRAASYSDVLAQFVTAPSQYSFTFNGEVGRLDHVFATSGLNAQITGATIWHINADEPDVFDYNTESKPDDRYAATPFRSADHDPVVIGLNLFTPITISGQKFDDLNGNGVKDSGEPGLDGVTINLDKDANGSVDATATTSGGGNYSFTVLSAGAYRIREVVPVGYVQTTANPADIVAQSGVNVTGVDFGNFKLISISGQKFDDLNGNGVKDSGEPGLGGVTINLDKDANGSVDATTTTSGAGNYSFSNLGPGAYRIREAVPAGYVQTTANPADIVASSGANVTGVDFGNFKLISISGQKFDDLNGNGAKDSGEPGLDGVTINLDKDANGSVDATTTTSGGGSYSFPNLGAGTYRIRESVPTGYVQTTANPADIVASSGMNVSGVDFGNFNCAGITVNPAAIPGAFKGSSYSQTFTQTSAAPVTWSLTGSLPAGLNFNAATATLSGTPTATGVFNITVRATFATGCFGERAYTLAVNATGGSIGDPVVCNGPGDVVKVTATVTNNGAAAQASAFTATLDPTLRALPGTCAANTGTCSVDNASTVTWTGTLNAGQTVTITYQAQIADGVPAGTQVCVNSTATVGGSVVGRAKACAPVNCPAIGPGEAPQADSPVSGQKAGSVLIYNVYTSSASDANSQNTRINLTNVDQKRSVFVHLFFVDGETCSVADNYLCLTANQTTTFLTSDVDPGTTGYLVVVAIDSQGCPTSFNNLIGDEFVKFSSGHAANLGAEAISALAGGLPRCDGNSVTARLDFDGKSYNALPRVLALSNVVSRADGNDTMLILNRIGGDLMTSAATLTNVFGIFYDDTENSLSFGFNPKLCQFRSSITSSFPRITPRFDQFVPAGRSGWFKLYSVDDQAILGAAINFNQNGESLSGAFNQGHNLHKLTLTTSASFTIPVFPPSC